MIIKSFKINKKLLFYILLITFVSIIICFVLSNVIAAKESVNTPSDTNSTINWVDFNVTATAMKAASKIDIDSNVNNEDIKFNWIELLAILACHNGGNFKSFKQSQLDAIVDSVKSGKSIEDLSNGLKLYSYYLESYTAALGGFIGNYSVEAKDENGNIIFEDKYGVKVFSPIAKNYYYSHYDDFRKL